MSDKKGWVIAAIVLELVTLILMYINTGGIEISWMLVFPLIVVGLVYAVADTIKKRSGSSEYVPPRLEKSEKVDKGSVKETPTKVEKVKQVKNTEDDDFL